MQGGDPNTDLRSETVTLGRKTGFSAEVQGSPAALVAVLRPPESCAGAKARYHSREN